MIVALARSQAFTTKKFIELCLDLRCKELVGTVMERVLQSAGSGTSALWTQDYAQAVMLPLIAFCAERMRVNAEDVPSAELKKLQETGVKF